VGKYQQWLHYRETEALLQEKLAQIEGEMAQLEASMQSREQDDDLSQNPIILALKAGLIEQEPADQAEPALSSATTRPLPAITSLLDETTAPGEQSATDAPPAVISPALRAWGDLPDFNAETPAASPGDDAGFPGPPPDQRLSPMPHSEIVLLPDDMNTFFEQHSQTDPQLDLPWWLRTITMTPGDDQGNGPIDPQSVRTNRLVQRWLERWSSQRHASRESEERSQ